MYFQPALRSQVCKTTPLLSPASNSSYSDHVNRKHQRRYKCNFDGCSSAFNLRADLTRHTKTHKPLAAQERFPCQVPGCQKFYTRLDNLQKHVKKHSR